MLLETKVLYGKPSSSPVNPIQKHLVFGQMNETPGARMRVGHAALSVAEFFTRDLSLDVLMFVDNVR